MSRIKMIRNAFAIALVALLPFHVGAQTYPEQKPLRIVVGFPPGGSVDAVVRILADKLRPIFPQGIVVDNRAGGGGTIAAEFVARSAPDGHTIMLGGGGTLAFKDKLVARLPYSVTKSFAPIVHVVDTPLLLVVPSTLPAKSIKELIGMANSRPNALFYGSSGTGSTGQLSAELFNKLAGITTTGVAYKGSAPMMNDLIGGQISFAFDQIATTGPNVAAGRLRALAISTKKRSSLMPDVPTMAESGVPGYESISWSALVAPAGTPKHIIKFLQDAVNKVLVNPSTRTLLAGVGAVPVGGTSEELGVVIANERDKWGHLIDDLGIKPE
ncbi:tripartite tricarboxylate transporter substrate binding protein [Polaromonas sp. P1(28)-13]|nr:tripartite tricarboxylate transporter substrate binding protein [Polaromonas sp. P1(28)-13]